MRKVKKNDSKYIGEILGLLEEKEKNKEWILEELKRKKIKLKVSITANSYEILNGSPEKFVNHVYNLLKDDVLDIKEVKTLSKTFHWFFIDIVSSADPTMTIKSQARKIRTLNEIIKRTEVFKRRDPKSDIIHWTGDGMAIGFSDSPEKPLQLAIEIHKVLDGFNESRAKKYKIYTRIGLNTGDVFFIEDIEGRRAFWGDGIVTARRVMDLCGLNQIFASDKIANGLNRLSHQNKSIIHSIGEYEIKHDEEVSIFNIYGKGFGNKKAPQEGKVQKLKPTDIVESNTNSYKFKEVEIILDVKNSQTMMTHHTWIWKVENIRKEKENPLSEIFYSIEGDIPRGFSDLNLRVRDGEGNKLKIKDIVTNKDTIKEFSVGLKKPIKYKKKQTLILEFDWEEPDRKYVYILSTDCEKLKYQLIIPKKMQLRNRVLKVNPGTNEKIKAVPSADIIYLKNKTKVTWESIKKLKEHNTFEFNW